MRDAYHLKHDDVLFGQDCVGDQFVLRAGIVHKLYGETGELESLGESLSSFLDAARANPREALSNEPLLRLQQEGGRLEPGQLLSVWPPYCSRESAAGVSIKAIAASDRLSFLADFSKQLRSIPDGDRVTVKITD